MPEPTPRHNPTAYPYRLFELGFQQVWPVVLRYLRHRNDPEARREIEERCPELLQVFEPTDWADS